MITDIKETQRDWKIRRDCTEECGWILYSTLYLKKGVETKADNRLFSRAWEDWGTGSNMDSDFSLPLPQQFDITGLVVNGSRNRSEEMYNTLASFYDNYYLDLWLGQKTYYGSPLTFFPLNADYQTIWDEGKETFRKPEDVKFDPPLFLPCHMTFNLQVSGNPIVPEVDAKIVFGLRGKIYRGVS
jgi:hypothetical protein